MKSISDFPLRFLFSTALIIIMGSSAFLIAGSTDALGSPRIELDVYQDRSQVGMTADPSTEILLNGTVSVQVPWSPSIQAVEVTMKVLTEGYNWVFSPTVLVFENDGERTQHFDLRLSVPKSIPAGENLVEIGGYWKNTPGSLGGTISSDNVILDVSVFQDGKMDAPMEARVKEGSSSSVPLVIRNTGNIDQDYLLVMEGDDTLRNVGVDVEVENFGYLHADIEELVEVVVKLNASKISSERTYYLVVKLLDMDEGLEYDYSTIAVQVMDSDEPSSPGTVPSGGDDDGNDKSGDAPVDDTEDSTVHNGGSSSSSPAIFYFIGIVIVIGVLAAAGVVFVSRNNR